jgi:hypothetical protein
VDTLGDADGMPGVAESVFFKEGEHSVGVERQSSGTAGPPGGRLGVLRPSSACRPSIGVAC